jgi:molybdenum cofactor biosynthesis protein MoaC
VIFDDLDDAEIYRTMYAEVLRRATTATSHAGSGSSRAVFSPTSPKQMQATGRSPAANTKPKNEKRLTHLTATGAAHMVAVTQKESTHRRAIAVGSVLFSERETIQLIRNALIKKGDVLGTARLAGIMAAKHCPALIPLCHPITLSGVRVEVELLDTQDTKGGPFGGVHVEAEVECVGPTGVEMEALTSVAGALLTVIDMVKGVDRGAKIDGVRLVLKQGGRSGLWQDESWISEQERKGLP